MSVGSLRCQGLVSDALAGKGAQAHSHQPGTGGLGRLGLALGLAVAAELLAFWAPETREFQVAGMALAAAAAVINLPIREAPVVRPATAAA